MTGGKMPESPAERMVAALRDPYALFNRDQIPYLMAAAARWGRESVAVDLVHAYEQGRYEERRRLTELNLHAIRTAIDEKPFSAKRTQFDIDRRARREAADAASRERREGDYLGGPVADWGYPPEDVERVERMNDLIDRLPRVPNPTGRLA